MGILDASTVAETAPQRVKKLADKYMVARNFVDGELDDAVAQQHWQDVVECVSEAVADTSGKTDVVVDRLACRLGGIFPDSRARAAPALLSAASKFLWFGGRHDVRIYDKRAVNALNGIQREKARADGMRKWRVNGSYTNFAEAWGREYAAHEKKIRAATAALGSILDWSIIPPGAPRAEALQIAEEPWFSERAFDKYLWTIGASDESSVGSFI